MWFYVSHSLVQWLGRCLLKLLRRTFLVHRSNSGRMPFLTPTTTLLGVGGTPTRVHASTNGGTAAKLIEIKKISQSNYHVFCDCKHCLTDLFQQLTFTQYACCAKILTATANRLLTAYCHIDCAVPR